MLVVNTLFVNQPIRYFNWPRKKKILEKLEKKMYLMLLIVENGIKFMLFEQ